RLVGGGRHEIGVFHGAGVQADGDQAGNVRDVSQQISADRTGDFTHALKVDDARIGAGADGDHAGAVFLGHFLQLIVIDGFVLAPDTVMDDLKETAGEVGLVAVGKVAAVREVHGQHLVAGLENGEIDGHVGLAAGVGLDIGVLGAEDALGAFNGQPLHDVHVFAAAVPAFAGVALGVFIGQDRALCFQDGEADKVFAGNQLDVFLLALAFEENGVGDFGVHGLEFERRGSMGGFHFGNALFVAAPLKLSGQKGLDYFYRVFRRD